MCLDDADYMMLPAQPADGDVVASTRLLADRRSGLDRRRDRRRQVVADARPQRRRVVDRRRGDERRSTLDRRGRAVRQASEESPGEHLRNALQLLAALALTGALDPEQRNHLVAALGRLRRALSVLDRPRGSPHH
jgi:hypothetical protein